MNGWTSGPLHVRTPLSGGYLRIVDDDGRILATIGNVGIADSTPPEDAANAALWAAAPDLAAAWAILIDGDGQPDECPRAMKLGRAALEKARGES